MYSVNLYPQFIKICILKGGIKNNKNYQVMSQIAEYALTLLDELDEIKNTRKE